MLEPVGAVGHRLGYGVLSWGPCQMGLVCAWGHPGEFVGLSLPILGILQPQGLGP